MIDPIRRADQPHRLRLIPADPHLGWTPYLWLFFLISFLIKPLVRARLGVISATYAAATILGLLVFLASYFRGFWTNGRELLLIVVLQTLLGAAFAPINSGSTVFFIYAASFAGYFERSRTAILTIILVSVAGLLSVWLTAAPLPFWIPAVPLPLLIGLVNVHQAGVQRSNAKLRLAQEQIEHLAAVAERERIARDLHDVLGHTLSLIVLKSELATRDPARATAEIRDIEQVARTALREVREAIRGYRTSLAEEAERSQSLLDAAGIRAEFAIDPVDAEPAVTETLALTLREAVTNVARHSGATVCRVRLDAEADHCVLRVEDDGTAGEMIEGSGLRGMRERVEALGGSVGRGGSTAGRGMHLEVRVPLARPAPSGATLPLRSAANG